MDSERRRNGWDDHVGRDLAELGAALKDGTYDVRDLNNASPSRALRQVSRWQEAGGLWRVVRRGEGQATVALHSCEGREEMIRITSTDQDLLDFLGHRTSSEE